MPCRLAVGTTGRSASIGVAVDISLDGLFVMTDRPLPIGTLLPLALPVDDGEIVARAEVVRHKENGMGLRLLDLDSRDARRLRRFVGDLNSVDGTRRTAQRLLDVAGRTVQPITDARRIRGLLERARQLAIRVTLIPTERPLRELARVIEIGQTLTLRSTEASHLRAGEDVLVLTTVDFVSYTFQTHLLELNGDLLVLPVPDAVAYSERRSETRDLVDAHVELPRPWGPMRWPVLEVSDGGLSFLAEPESCQLTRGQPLLGARLVETQGSTLLVEATVRHLTEVPEGVKVGVSHGLAEDLPTTQEVDTGEGATGLARLGRWFKGTVGKAGALLRSKTGDQAPYRVVTLSSRNGLKMRGLLNVAYSGDRTRAPLVLVMPGYGGRKEQLGALAYTLVENFRRHHRDIAVLRVDGTNNLGESEKSPGNTADGRHNMAYTVSGVVADLLGCLDWARNNPFVQPTRIVVVSASFSSVGVCRALATEDCSDVSQWVAFMGAADAQDAILHVSGGQDVLGNYHRGIRPVGIITLIGCMTDGDTFCADLAQNHGGGTLRTAMEDMGRIRADVTWVVGEQDAFMDPARVEKLMRVSSPGERRILRSPCPHVPRSSEEACELFLHMTRDIWRHLYGSVLEEPVIPRAHIGEGWIAEWARVRSAPTDREGWWRTYLLGDEGGPGFDVLRWSPRYTAFIDQQLGLLQPTGRVLDLGAGTGNVTTRLLERDSVKAVVSVDLVPEAVARLREKAGDDPRLDTVVLDVDGNPRTAMARWRRGELADVGELLSRSPGVPASLADKLRGAWSPALHAALRGAALDMGPIAAAAGLDRSETTMLRDLNTLARVSAGRIPVDEARLHLLSPRSLRCRPGLPFADAGFDGVIASLLLSYLDHPEDTLADLFRVLKPGGTLVLSSMKPDADSSRLFTELIEQLTLQEETEKLEQARRFLDHASALLRLEEEGVWRFYSADELTTLALAAGFEEPLVERGFGEPAQAIVLRVSKPG